MCENINEKMRLVECDNPNCNHIFEIPKSIIKTIAGSNYFLYESVECLKCHKKSKLVRDYELTEDAKIKARIKANSPISCPVCKSTQIYASDKGFSTSKAFVGGALLGSVGLLAGFHGSKKVMLTCLSCGKKWEVGK